MAITYRRFLYMDETYGFQTEHTPANDGLNLGELTMAGEIKMGSNKITGLAAGAASTDAVTKGQLDTAVISGGKIKELLLHPAQCDNTYGVLAAVALTMQNQPESGDLITLTDGTTTRVYGATAGGDVQYNIGGSEAATMANLAAAILGDAGGAWDAYFTTALDSIDPTGVVVIVERDNTVAPSKIWGTWDTQTDCEIVDFGAEVEYVKSTLSDIPSSLPTATNFGMLRVVGDVVAGEIHFNRTDDQASSWDEDATAWFTMTGPGSIPNATSASGGGVLGKVTFDSDLGLSVDGSGVASILIDDTPDTLDVDDDGLRVVGLPSSFKINDVATSGATVTAANLDDLTDGSTAETLHTHEHVDRTEESYTAAENLAKADPVYATAVANNLGKALASDDAKATVVGLARLAANSGLPVPITFSGLCKGLFVGATPGSHRYLAAAGGLVSAIPAAPTRVIYIGTVVNTTDLVVSIRDFGKKAV